MGDKEIYLDGDCPGGRCRGGGRLHVVFGEDASDGASGSEQLVASRHQDHKLVTQTRQMGLVERSGKEEGEEGRKNGWKGGEEGREERKEGRKRKIGWEDGRR